MAIANKFPTIYLLLLIILTQKAKVQNKIRILNWKEKRSLSLRLLHYDWHSFAKGRLSQVITHFQVYPCWETYLTFTRPHNSRKMCPKTLFSHSTALQMRCTSEEEKIQTTSLCNQQLHIQLLSENKPYCLYSSFVELCDISFTKQENKLQSSSILVLNFVVQNENKAL